MHTGTVKWLHHAGCRSWRRCFRLDRCDRPLAALAYASPTVRFDWISGIGETATWQWTDQTGTVQGTATGIAGGTLRGAAAC